MRDHKTLLAWQEAREVSRAALHLSRNHWSPAGAGLLAQLQRAALSVQVNIAEGYGLKTSAQFRRHLNIAYGSALETADLLELGLESKLVPEAESKALDHCRRCQALILGLIKSPRRS
ncbi:MAG TPA: four helix bundle protein [Gemmatimonadales bacterium]